MATILTRKSYLAAAALVATLALVIGFQWGSGSPVTALSDEAGNGGTGDHTGIVGKVSYIVTDARGNVLDSATNFNTVNNEGKDDTFNLITGNSGAGAFDNIAALNVAVGTDDPADGVLSTSITTNLDGAGNDSTHENPADGTVATDFGTENGNGTVVVTFTAKADSTSVTQIVLTNTAPDDTAASGTVAIADSTIFAYIDVPDVSLNTGDSVQYTWSIDVD
jgi:hypothetical protein